MTLPMTVVGAAILDGHGRVLAAQRSGPPELAGGWEFPGGKVEPGEDEAAAVVRECREELGIEVSVGERLGADVPLTGGGVLRVWLCCWKDGVPEAIEHRALVWLDVAELDEVAWLAADAPLVDALRAHLTPSGRS